MSIVDETAGVRCSVFGQEVVWGVAATVCVAVHK
jgi:hypothetical protein